MSDNLRILHNPRCSKSRATKQLIDDTGISVETVDYLKTPPTVAELEHILSLLKLEPRELMRKHEAPYKALNLDDESLGRAALIQAMVDNPILIERPIVIKGDKAVIGRPPENVLDLI